MKRTLRFAALVAVVGLTSWPAAGLSVTPNTYPRCSVFQGGFCTGGSMWCSLIEPTTADGYCVCASGRWDCGCNTYAECF